MEKLKKIIVVLVALNLVACAAVAVMFLSLRGREMPKDTKDSAPKPPAQTQEAAPEEAPDTEPEVTSPEPEEEVVTTLAFAGDILLDDRVMPNYDARGIGGLLDETMLEVLSGADITMVNEEFPFATRGEKAPDKQFTFLVNPRYTSAFQDMGADIVSLANNHALDFGTLALTDTFDALDDAGILYAGAGETKERAKELQRISVNGKKFGFLAASRVIPVTDWNVDNVQPGLFCTYDDTQLVEEIRKAKESCDFVTVFVHWGKEKTTKLEDHQTQLAHDYINAGADLVIGSHPHILQGVEYYKGKPIFYSLGNFIFGLNNEQTAAVQVTVNEAGEAAVRIVAATAVGGQTCVMDEENARKLYDMLEELSPTVSIDDEGLLSQK